MRYSRPFVPLTEFAGACAAERANLNARFLPGPAQRERLPPGVSAPKRTFPLLRVAGKRAPVSLLWWVLAAAKRAPPSSTNLAPQLRRLQPLWCRWIGA